MQGDSLQPYLKMYLMFVLVIWLSLSQATETVPHAPHIIVVVVDDFGYADVGYHNGQIPTPYIDHLSSQVL